MMGRKRGSPYGLGGPNGVTYVQPNMSTKVRQEAGDQLAGYVKFRMNQTGLRYVGVLTHGTQWAYYDLVDDKLRPVSGSPPGSN
jgi:hypothetical protein